MRRMTGVAIGFALAAAAISLAFVVLTLQCGMRTISPGDAHSQCVSAVHPAGLLQLGLAVAAAWSLYQQMTAGAVVFGVVSLIVGTAFGLSGGWFTLGPGI